MADTGKIKEMKDREERCERAQKYVNELQEVHQRVQFEAKGTQKKLMRYGKEPRRRRRTKLDVWMRSS